MEIQLDPRGIRIRTKAGWISFSPTDPVERVITALIEDRQGKASLPTDSLGTMAHFTSSTADLGATGPIDHIQGTAQGKWRKVPMDPRLRRVIAKPAPARRTAPQGMTLDELMS